MRFPEINTLLIHIPKTGGTTITGAIAKHLYPEKLIKYSDILNLYLDREKSLVKRNRSKAHVYASTYRKIMGDDVYDEHYSFAIVRNPFEQIRSLFGQLIVMNIKVNPRFIPYKTLTFEQFVMNSDEFSIEGQKQLIDQELYVKDRRRKKIIVDDIFPFDYYKEVLKIVGDKIGIDIDPGLILRPTENNKDCYSPEMVTRVLDLYGHVYDLYKEVKNDFEKNVLSKI